MSAQVEVVNYHYLTEVASCESVQPFPQRKMETIVLGLAVCRRLPLIGLSEIACPQGIA